MADLKDYKLDLLKPEHSTLVWEWRNAGHIRPWMNQDKFIPLEAHCRWLEALEQDTGKLVRLCFYKERPIGLVQFSQLDPVHRTCEWGFYLGEKDCPPGSGTRMGLLALELIFTQRGMRKVGARILDFNCKSLAYHRKLGFVEEGRLSRQLLRNQQAVDVVLMGLFQEQWELRKETLKA